MFWHDRNRTILPVILISDKTTMMKLLGNQMAYPVYLTIENINKSFCCNMSMYATSIVGYLPVNEFRDVSDEELQTQLKGELVHKAVCSIMKALETTG
jgi:hypothetical protein